MASFGVDETASKRGYNYVSVFIDLRTHKVLFASPRRTSPLTGSTSMKVLNDAVNQVRREEAKIRPELAKSRYIWL